MISSMCTKRGGHGLGVLNNLLYAVNFISFYDFKFVTGIIVINGLNKFPQEEITKYISLK